jgi:hypothetical protein
MFLETTFPFITLKEFCYIRNNVITVQSAICIHSIDTLQFKMLGNGYAEVNI